MLEKLIFHHLPFTPTARQVIYFEPEYDDECNRFLSTHFDQLLSRLYNMGLELIYFPRLLLDGHLEEKVRYYAPYLRSKILDESMVQTSLLMRYLKESEVHHPSLLFNPEQKNGEWLFDVQILPIGYPDPIQHIEESLLERCYASIRPDSPLRKVKFAIETGAGITPSRRHFRFHDLQKNESEFPVLGCPSDVSEESSTLVTEMPTSYFDGYTTSDISLATADAAPSATLPVPQDEPSDEVDTEDIKEMLEELRQLVERMELKGIARAAIHEFIDSGDKLSRLIITSDYRFLLPDYDLEIELTPIRKALYLLFLRYPDGIRLKELSDHFRELLVIYRQMNPRLNEDKRVLTVTQLCNSTSNRASENIAAIRCTFCSKFDEHLAKEYLITGSAGQPYKIPLDRSLVNFEE